LAALIPFQPAHSSDSACNTNGGIGVDIRNPGCLGEAGRGSVYIPNTGLGTTGDNQYCLVKTFNDGSCSCQNQGYDFTATGFCAVLDPSVQSYRFISVSAAMRSDFPREMLVEYL
jgi:hypothetical protein